MLTWRLLGGLVCGAIVVLASGPKPTFNHDIAPIIFHYCANCHRPGEAGPFPLLNYRDVKAHASQIAAVTHSRFMPPWLPDPGPFPFAEERRLSDEQIALIRRLGGNWRFRRRSRERPKAAALRTGMAVGKARFDPDGAKAISSARLGNRCVLELHSASSRGANQVGKGG